ncbi:MAG: anthranilate phosphoribosyltransferase [Candidatus Pristimantibacillus lignocellulolyticus]|uniref:Anthranilate phosphoribosyltransferase n=1 Tax=Candidatus Pristimantibacillus lignocellulolyticus TaxID=2994561 RepID=A0A9J6ZDL9_9BACL|nr:MAG: anthranilate phosphoribosyltransferase [Candidatus Pristimantibacillus lignocellulolyticus]
MSEAISMQQAIAKLVSSNDLSRAEAQSVMTQIMNGEATSAQIGAAAIALRMKGETKDEITGLAEVMRSFSNHVDSHQSGLLDTCGTGGSGISKFNISTASSLIAAAAGITVAKHGNRAMSGKSGSADVLEALGVNINVTPEQAKACLDEVGICFMFAQLYHPSLKHAAGPRKEIGTRTIFNMLGPLTNPAGADRQLLGLYDASKTEIIAEVLRELGITRALVVSSFDGLDEISISSSTKVSELKDGSVTTYHISPEQLGLVTRPLSDVLGGEPAQNAQIIREIFDGTRRDGYRDIVLANAGACIYLGGLSNTHAEGVKIAAEIIDSGKAALKLDQLIQKTGELNYVS